MNPQRPDAFAPDSTIGTSALGKGTDPMTAALDDAMAKLASIKDSTISQGPNDLADASPSQSTTQSPASGGSIPWTAASLIEAMAQSSTRRLAIESLVRSLASLCPQAAIRAGIGRGRMAAFVDHRLGWLGPESSLQQKATERWSGQTRRKSDQAGASPSAQPTAPESPPAGTLAMGTPESPCVRGGDSLIELHLPMESSSDRCVVWIEGELGQIDWLPSLAPAINSVLWSRPKRSLPSIAVRLAKRSTWVCGLLAVAALVAAFWPVAYRVSCVATVQTTGGRFISAPFEATVAQVHAIPGDAVQAGDVLLVLDGRPLRLERESLSAEIGQVSREYDVAIANRRIAEAQQAGLKRQKLQRQLDLITDRLSRLEVTSPIDGIVVSGDLEKHVGTPLEQGQALFEVAALDRMRVEIQIPEYDIRYVNQGNQTRIKIDAVGGPSLRMPLDQLFPESEVRDDQNVFIGQVDLENQDASVRPGMKGEAIIYGPQRPWIWSWLRGSFERVLWWGGY